MRIMNVMFSRGLGGIEQCFLDYTHTLTKRGHEVISVAHPSASVLSEIGGNSSQIHTLRNLGEWDPIAFMRLRSLIARHKPDVIIAHGNRALRLLSCAKAKPLVTVLHNYKIHMHYAHAVIAPTQALIREALEQQYARDRLHLVPNMVQAPFTLKARQFHSPPVIGLMGRMVAKKGFDLLLASLALLKQKNVNFRAILAGDGKEHDALQAKAQALGLSNIVTFPGWVEDKQQFFDQIDIFCLPSHHEPFGIVLLEAMAAGLPVISTASEGPSEIIQHGVNGLLAPINNAKALADAVESLLNDRAKAHAMAGAGYDTVRAQYDMDVTGAKLELALRACCTL